MKNFRPPEFLQNLYRDMRDRRLLLPAAALIIALIAVPVLLGTQSSSSAPPASTSATNASASAVTPAVVSRQLGVTNYRKRLEELQSKNPFHQQYTQPPESAALNATSGSGSDTGSSTTGGTGGTSATGDTSTVTGSPSGAGSPSISPGSTGSAPSPPARSGGPKPGFHLYTYRISVKVGEPGKLRERPQVSRLALLPNKKKPIVSFIGVSEGGKQALFLVSQNVDSVGGDGRCVPGRDSCQYVIMSPGDKVNLQYRPDNKRYNLILTGIHAVEIDDKPPAKVAGKAEPMAKLPELGPG